MSTPKIGWCVVYFALSAGCSSDSGPAPASSSGGSTSSGGAKSTGGATSTGGAAGASGATGTGGYDPALAAQCSIDSTGDQCKICLAVNCCNAVEACFSDSGCMAAFSTYQTCLKKPGQADLAGCLSGFTRYAKSDGGIHQDVAGCIITTCNVCGGVQQF